ncbi:hypothetical protein AJ80_05137 [Polytolypa hystricis UAMH7299]|uniref:Uncharacterized protein n=1 Tax=Polytolypa hystricis (strain UAMH7299) TaxID=1447883 RepID=A0A2B7Y5Z9_POLH7|nr:hypothetical protein AJ80_05137 [Polytolypa hystricis UAMH7299]
MALLDITSIGPSLFSNGSLRNSAAQITLHPVATLPPNHELNHVYSPAPIRTALTPQPNLLTLRIATIVAVVVGSAMSHQHGSAVLLGLSGWQTGAGHLLALSALRKR